MPVIHNQFMPFHSMQSLGGLDALTATQVLVPTRTDGSTRWVDEY